MSIRITAYNAACAIGSDIQIVYNNALGGISSFKYYDNYIKNTKVYLGLCGFELPEIKEPEYNLRCCALMLHTIKNIEKNIQSAVSKYGRENVGIVCAGTNSGIEEFETSKRIKHFELGNPAEFLHKHLGLKGYYTGVSTACSSGIKALSLSRDLINSGICSCVIIAAADTAAKVPVYGFNSLGVLSDRQSLPFSRNRCGMNISEGCAVFIIEKDAHAGIEIAGIGESSDITHMTCPDKNACASAAMLALADAGIEPECIDYINAHGTGTRANDLTEAEAINSVFGSNIPVSSTKPLTGHCLGAAAGIETALCCALLDNFNGRLFPHIYDGIYDASMPEIRLAKADEIYAGCRICACLSSGFGGADAAVILKK